MISEFIELPPKTGEFKARTNYLVATWLKTETDVFRSSTIVFGKKPFLDGSIELFRSSLIFLNHLENNRERATFIFRIKLFWRKGITKG
ncbi:hypothetical protein CHINAEXTREME_17100 [Halobiforma lacisalsi AJ5]|uniref:Uncharacterized protein n=1 Tax=Natronobacterium lacisalsi AJ5 TaxID=358396 RepID=M0LRX0_NATLA|nr:hypothetical protein CHINAEXTREME_17100 [Halobiforma lacisalsi AJ5]EMA35184.1 hypothetical protein C445_05678 [Halobiforma lacisalsi AJ5]